jgi:hypothetical protein
MQRQALHSKWIVLLVSTVLLVREHVQISMLVSKVKAVTMQTAQRTWRLALHSKWIA